MRTPKWKLVTIAAALMALLAPIALHAQERTLIPAQAIRDLLAGKAPNVPAPAPTDRVSAQATPPSHNQNAALRCKGPVKKVVDVAYEGLKLTQFNWSSTAGGGDSGRYDKTPVLTTTVNLTEDCSCLDAHFSAIVGSRQTYGAFLPISAITMFQVTLTPASGGPPMHMVGHYDFPYGTYGPAVALEAERDVDMIGANFFQRVGDEPGDVPPGVYRVDVWWSGGPATPGGALAMDFVLKLYQR